MTAGCSRPPGPPRHCPSSFGGTGGQPGPAGPPADITATAGPGEKCHAPATQTAHPQPNRPDSFAPTLRLTPPGKPPAWAWLSIQGSKGTSAVSPSLMPPPLMLNDITCHQGLYWSCTQWGLRSVGQGGALQEAQTLKVPSSGTGMVEGKQERQTSGPGDLRVIRHLCAPVSIFKSFCKDPDGAGTSVL